MIYKLILKIIIYISKLKNTNKTVIKRNDCRVCGNKHIKEIFDFGSMPMAGGFLNKNEIKKKELKVPLKIFFCEKCLLLQVKDSINYKILFNDYKYSSSTIPDLNNHFYDYFIKIKNKFKKEKKINLLEFGSNDGVLLKYFLKSKKFFCLGVDPAKNISNLALKKKINTFVGLFNVTNAKKIKLKHGKFDYITGSNVFAHINDIHSVVDAAKTLLKNGGVFATEVHYLPNLLKLNQYDFIYHEHLNYYTVTSLIKLFELHNMNLFDVEMIPTHGGSVRVYVSKNLKKRKKQRLNKLIKSENKINIKYLFEFRKKITKQKNLMIRLLDKINKIDKKIVGYGASGRGTILLNYCNIDKKKVKCIIDDSPLRYNKFMPGVKIPIYNEKYLKKKINSINYILIIAWNYKASIMKKMKKMKKNIKFIIPFPFPKVI